MAAAINLPPTADHAPSIADLTLRCQGALDDCRQIAELQHDEWVDLRFTDFNSWVESSGALAIGRASLDSRLDGTEDMKDMVTDSLEILEIALLGCIKTACDSTHKTDNAHNDTPDVSGSGSVLVEAKDDVLQLITQLLSLTCSIREVDTKTKLNSADEIFDADRHSELFFHLILILQAKAWTRSEREDWIRQIDSNKSPLDEIQTRIVLANLRRRNRFLHAQNHTDKPKEQKYTANTRKSTSRRVSDFLSRRLESEVAGQVPADSGSTRVPATSSAANTSTVAPSSQDTKHTTDSTSSSVITISGTYSQLRYPRVPRTSKSMQTFKCPSCCHLLPLTDAEPARWRRHLNDDLAPFTCVLRECRHPDKLYDDYTDWTKHMREEHSSSKFWLCTMCNVETRFSDEKSFAQHLSSQHEATVPLEHLDIFVQAASRSAPLELDQCPLCPPGKTFATNTSALVDHVARHLQDFALYSLPWSTPAEDEADLVRMGKRSVSGVNEPLSYFDQNEYFDVKSHASTSTLLSEARSLQLHELPELPDTGGLWDVVTVHKQALKINRDLFGENHVQTVSSRCVLAEALVIEGQHTEAMRLLFGMLFPVGSLSDAAAIRSKIRDMRAHQQAGRLDIAAKLRIHLLANCVLTTTGQAVGVYMEDRFDAICSNLNDNAHPERNVLSRSIEEARNLNLQDHIDTLKLAVKLCIALDWIHPQAGQDETLRKAIEQSRVLAEDIAALGRTEQLGPLPPPPPPPTVVSTHHTDAENANSEQSHLNLFSTPAISESPSVMRISQSEQSRIHSASFLKSPTVHPDTEQPMLTLAPLPGANSTVKRFLDREPSTVPVPSLSNTSTSYYGQMSSRTDHSSERAPVSPLFPMFNFSDPYFYSEYQDPTYEEDGKVDSFNLIDSTYGPMWDRNRNEFTNSQPYQPWIPTGSALSAAPLLYSSSLLPQSYETSASFPTSSLDHPSESIDYEPGMFEPIDNRPRSEGDEQAKTLRNPRNQRRPYHIGTPDSDDDDNSSKKSHRCYVPGCINMNGFASSSGLVRHQREVHGMHGGVKEKLFCRYLNCKRHIGKEFARRANRDQHEKRIHGGPFLPEVAKAAAAERKANTAGFLRDAKPTTEEEGSGKSPTIAPP